ncbi:MAG: hypothetical protein KF742_02505 [Cryobacterium sp.]|nr:hypothetical protein [Cryobacterium sp.]
MTESEGAPAEYDRLFAELERANARAAENPADEELAAKAAEAYQRAQEAYARVLAEYEESSGEDRADSESQPDSTSESEPEAKIKTEQPAATATEQTVPDSPSIELPDGQVEIAQASAIITDPVPEYDLGDFGPPVSVAAPAFGEKIPEPFLVLPRKSVATRFVPSDTSIEELTPISRSLLPHRATGGKSQLSRERNIAGSLPNWAPLPPGEIVPVKRIAKKS